VTGPLEGIRVVDLSQVISGPWATMLLADQGAEVIKVEPCVGGEVLRPLPNFGRGGINSLIANNNRGKLGLAIDLGAAPGLATLRRVIDTADVLVQNFRPGVAERLGLAPDVLRSTNPRLVTCAITGFGPDGLGRAGFGPGGLGRAGIGRSWVRQRRLGAGHAADEGIVSPDEKRSWLLELQERNDAGRFFAAWVMFIVTGKKG